MCIVMSEVIGTDVACAFWTPFFHQEEDYGQFLSARNLGGGAIAPFPPCLDATGFISHVRVPQRQSGRPDG